MKGCAWGFGYCIDGSCRSSRVLGRPWHCLVGTILGLGSVGLEVGEEVVCAEFRSLCASLSFGAAAVVVSGPFRFRHGPGWSG